MSIRLFVPGRSKMSRRPLGARRAVGSGEPTRVDEETRTPVRWGFVIALGLLIPFDVALLIYGLVVIS